MLVIIIRIDDKLKN